MFPDARLAKAVVDRLTHRAHIIDTGTESWRFKHGLSKTRALTPPGPRPRLSPLSLAYGSLRDDSRGNPPTRPIRQHLEQHQPATRWS